MVHGFGGEAVVAGGGAGLVDDVAEGVVALAGGDGAVAVHPGGDVAVAVVGGEVRDGGEGAGREVFGHDEAADSACGLHGRTGAGGTGHVHAPGEAADVGGAVVFEFDVPSVVEIVDRGL